ncbi:type III-B CRISPR module RAMP protein Cmr1 [Myxococcota bacterium]|nr:type III-B CRISPR module RAMP protein Cmr1 [Myxococcota bacterium]MBU1898655.1 type III-B CRISPR module RAMP protein Cmr1 [Myxococcota bacterium]
MLPAPIKKKTDASRGLVRLTREIELLTPVFGGGVHIPSHEDLRQKKDHDAITPIRGASIRGQLRFWWRATTGARMGSISAMRAREAALWGAASAPGKVGLKVRAAGLSVGARPVFEMKQSGGGAWNARALQGQGDLAYGAFPLQPRGGQQHKLEPGVLHEIKGKWALDLTAPDADAEEVELALEAWLAFGGLGGRTRRGFGALSGGTWALDRFDLNGVGLPNVPSLAGAVLQRGRQQGDGLAMQKKALAALRGFRQGEDFGRNPRREKDRPGRSRWPEPETIRVLTKQSDNDHAKRFVCVDKFPRAAFGMPIIFHFQSKQDPSDTTLKPVGKERLASPLILRPWTAPKQSRAIPLALVLGDPSRAALPIELKTARHSFSVEARLEPAEVQKIKPLNGQTDPLRAFLNFFQENC